MQPPINVRLHIGATQREVGSGGVFDHVNPHDGRIQARIPLAGVSEMNAAVDAAAVAFDGWRRWRPSARRDALMKLGDLIRSNGEEFARLTSLENGTAISVTAQHAAIAREWFVYYAGWCDKLDGGVTSTFMTSGDFSYFVPEPYGVVAAIVPWNGPLISTAMKAAPILAAGNSLVLKPSEFSPFSAELFAQCVQEAGIPPGVCNIVPGTVDAAQALLRHPKVEKVSFTGGAVTARSVLKSCAENLKPAVLELGGKSANIVFEDADLDAAAQHAALWSVGIYSGQGCVFPTRLLVQAEIYPEMVERVSAAARLIPMGDPLDPKMVRGPVVSFASADRILAAVESASKAGAGRIVVGGGRAGGALAAGAYVESTVLADVDPGSDIAQNEVFGPILAIMPFKDEAEAIRIANNTQYSLGAFIQTQDLNRAHRVAGELVSGGVFVNRAMPLEVYTPFGGGGLSGFGREGGKVGIEEFVRAKTVAIAR